MFGDLYASFLIIILHHPDCCWVMYCYSTFLFHYYYYYYYITPTCGVMYCYSTFLFHYYSSYYITPTVVGWCIAILRFFLTIFTSPRTQSGDVLLFYISFSLLLRRPKRSRVTYCYSTFLFSSPGPKVHVNYCHHLASVVCRLSSVVCRLSSVVCRL
jgi:hypothetical protein